MTAQYEVGKEWFFPTLGRKAYPGEVIDLPKDTAEFFIHNEPGLLKPTRKTTQARPSATRVKKVKVRRGK